MGTWQLTYGPYANIRPYVNMHTDPSASWARYLYSRLAAPAAPTVAGPLVCEGKGRRGERPPGWRRECVAAVHETVPPGGHSLVHSLGHSLVYCGHTLSSPTGRVRVHETVAAWQICGRLPGGHSLCGQDHTGCDPGSHRVRALDPVQPGARGRPSRRTQARRRAGVNARARTYTCRSSDAIQLGGARAVVSSPCACPPSC